MHIRTCTQFAPASTHSEHSGSAGSVTFTPSKCSQSRLWNERWKTSRRTRSMARAYARWTTCAATGRVGRLLTCQVSLTSWRSPAWASSFAGFAAVIAALDRRPSSPVSLWRISYIVRGGFILLFAGFGVVAVRVSSGISVLDGGGRTARSIAYSGTCPHCGAHTWGHRLHETCGALWCRMCKRCSSDATIGSSQKDEPVSHVAKRSAPIS